MPKERLLDAASFLFYSEGIRSVGVDRIALQADVTKATLYRLYQSKENLIVAYLRQRHQDAISLLRNSTPEGRDARKGVIAAFDSLEQKARFPTFRGCAFVMAVNEHPESQAISDVAREHKHAVRAYFSDLLRLAAEPASLAGYLAMLYDGALAGVSIERSAAPVITARQCAIELLEHLLDTKPHAHS
ncbi:TetR/AcrR family transcriptional regulator [Burkholderia stagnalis]